MKIINQTQDQMNLKDGNASSLIIGLVLILGGSYSIYHFYSASGPSNILWVAAVILLFGLIMIFLSSTITVAIDKSQNQISFLKKRLIGNKSQTFNIQDALRVELRKSYSMQSGTRSPNGGMVMPREVLNYQSVIIFKDGTELPLESVKSSGGTNIGSAVLMGGTGKELSMANQVANFLGVPFQEVGPGPAPTIMGMPPTGINL
jgi:hypothetical protein